MRTRVAAWGLAAALLAAAVPGTRAEPATPAAPTLVVFDNDFAGPGGPDIQPLVLLLGNPLVRLLGCTVVTGDGWVDEETAHLLRFLEVAGVEGTVPVAKGAEWPLINTPARMAIWERQFGKIPWKGAWNGPNMGPGFHPGDPHAVPSWPDGPPHAMPVGQSAAAFLVETVRAHPHEVTVLAAGPLTNLALAIRIDPEFARLAKQLVFMGGLVDTNLLQVTGNADFNSDFNLLFDPEAAHIVLTAPWSHVVSVGAVGNGTLMTPELVARLKGEGTVRAAYLAKYAVPNLPLWDELAAAIVADPTLVTKSVTAPMDVDIADGPDYGRAHVWPANLAPHMGEVAVTIVQEVDRARFVAMFLAGASIRTPKTGME